MEKHVLSKGISLYHIKTDLFKTWSLSLYIHRPLSKEEASKNALLTQVLKSGSKEYPTREDIARKLEELYGGAMEFSVRKKGEVQILSFGFEAPRDSYTGKKLSGELASFAISLITQPKVINEAFDEQIVAIEKENLKNQINAMINDKRTYSIERCIGEMCKTEPFGIYELGGIEEVDNITAKSLYEHYLNVLSNSSIDIYITGEDDIAEPMQNIKLALSYNKADRAGYPQTVIKKAPEVINEFTEELDVSQAKLVLGMRCDVEPASDDYYKLLVYNSVLGGGPHSKLFLNVREKLSLAYYAFSRLIRQKSVLIIGTGIEERNFTKARDEIFNQLQLIKDGQITQKELDASKAALINYFKAFNDSPFMMEDYYLSQLIIGSDHTIETAIEKTAAVTIEDVKSIAQLVAPDTQYLLKGRKGADANA